MQNQSGDKVSGHKPKIRLSISNNTTTVIFFIGAAVFFAGIIIGSGNLEKPSLLTDLFTILACLLISIDGIIVIIRREAPRPGLSSIKGIGAIISGLAILLTFGCGGIFLIWLTIVEYFGR